MATGGRGVVGTGAKAAAAAVASGNSRGGEAVVKSKF